MIKPTVGRGVWYRMQKPKMPEEQPHAAIITFVHDDRRVNITYFGRNGSPFGRTGILLIQDGDEIPEQTAFCEWMPYQKGQAAKTEALEAAAR